MKNRQKQSGKRSKLTRIVFLCFFSLVILGSCYRPSNRQAIEDMRAMEGEWVTVEGTRYNEVWEVINDSLLKGLGFSMNGADTAFTEQMKIYRMGDFVLFAAKVGESKDYVHFRLEEATKSSWTFVNPVHDYPNVISYTLNDKSKLTAKTTNSRGNKVQEFKFERVIE